MFTTSTRVQTFDGYLAVYQEAEEESDKEEAEEQAAEAQKLLKSSPKIAFEKPFRKAVDLFLNKKSVVFQVVFGTRNGGCSKNPRIQAWPDQKDHPGIIIG